MPYSFIALFFRLFSLLLTACGLYSMPLLAQPAENQQFYELQIRPSICVSFDGDQPCSMMLLISWEGSSRQPVCLKTESSAELINCWNGDNAGSLELPYESAGNVVYQLISMQNDRRLAFAEVQVISRDLRDSRRRRRHVWSIL